MSAVPRLVLDLDAIGARYAALDRVAEPVKPGLGGAAWVYAVALAAGLSAGDVPGLLAEVEQLRGELADLSRPAIRGVDRARFAEYAAVDAIAVHLRRAQAKAAAAHRDVVWLAGLLEQRRGPAS